MNNLLNFENPSDSKQNVQPNYSSQLTKTSSNNEIEQYFRAVLNLSQSNDEFPVDLDEVWPLVYAEKGKAARALKSNFIEGVDYVSFAKNGKREIGATTIIEYKLSVSCMEFFIARKVRPVFDVYRNVFHGAAKGNLSIDSISKKDIARMLLESETEKETMSLQIEEQEKKLQIRAPKVERYNQVMNNKGLITTNIVASYLNMSAIRHIYFTCAIS